MKVLEKRKKEIENRIKKREREREKKERKKIEQLSKSYINNSTNYYLY